MAAEVGKLYRGIYSGCVYRVMYIGRDIVICEVEIIPEGQTSYEVGEEFSYPLYYFTDGSMVPYTEKVTLKSVWAFHNGLFAIEEVALNDEEIEEVLAEMVALGVDRANMGVVAVVVEVDVE